MELPIRSFHLFPGKPRQSQLKFCLEFFGKGGRACTELTYISSNIFLGMISWNFLGTPVLELFGSGGTWNYLGMTAILIFGIFRI